MDLTLRSSLRSSNSVALQQLSIPLRRHLNLLCEMYKASSKDSSGVRPVDVITLFNDDFYNAVGYLDFAKNAPVYPPVDWFTYLWRSYSEFKSSIDNVVTKFGVYLGGDAVDILMKLKNANFIYLIENLKSLPDIDRRLAVTRNYNLLYGEDTKTLTKEYTDLFVQVLNYYNSTAQGANIIKLDPSIWNDNVSPKFGAGRLDGA